MCLNTEGGTSDVSLKSLVIWENHVVYYLKELLNFCITSGVYPNIFEIVQGTHIHKKGSPRDISNYRPVSVLSNLSKVFENIINNRLHIFYQTSNLIAQNRFGFRIKTKF